MDPQEKARSICEALECFADEGQRSVLLRFFKTGKGEYGEGDKFIGLKVPMVRAVVKEAGEVALETTGILLSDERHEVRLAGLLLLVKAYAQYDKEIGRKGRQALKASAEKARSLAQEIECLRRRKQEVVDYYLANAERANNWDLVDLSSPHLLGEWLIDETVDEKTKWQTLDALVSSGNLWRQRIAIVANWRVVRTGRFDFLEHYGAELLGHPHDLMHKAVGWMLREMGKVSEEELRTFLRQHYHELHRTTLRYAIEKLSADERAEWLEGKGVSD